MTPTEKSPDPSSDSTSMGHLEPTISTSSTSPKPGSVGPSLLRRSIRRGLSHLTLESARQRIEKSSWLIGAAVSRDPCLSTQERLTLLEVFGSGEPWSFSVRRDHTLVLRTSTRILAIGLGEAKFNMMTSFGASISTEISPDVEYQGSLGYSKICQNLLDRQKESVLHRSSEPNRIIGTLNS